MATTPPPTSAPIRGCHRHGVVAVDRAGHEAERDRVDRTPLTGGLADTIGLAAALLVVQLCLLPVAVLYWHAGRSRGVQPTPAAI